MKIIAKVISDNGYKIELIRPLRGSSISLGSTVELTLRDDNPDLVRLFENVLTDKTKDLIFEKFNESKRTEVSERAKPGRPCKVSV